MVSKTTNKLTAAQKRARDWLPADGSWRTDPGRLSAALNSLSFAWPGCVECEWASCGPRGGIKQRWRLNGRGVGRLSVSQAVLANLESRIP